MKIEIRKISEHEIEEMDIRDWPVWQKEASEFDWDYSDKETCYIIEGKAKVTANGQEAEFGKGDLVIFPKGLRCRWKIIEDLRKYYKLG